MSHTPTTVYVGDQVVFSINDPTMHADDQCRWYRWNEDGTEGVIRTLGPCPGENPVTQTFHEPGSYQLGWEIQDASGAWVYIASVAFEVLEQPQPSPSPSSTPTPTPTVTVTEDNTTSTWDDDDSQHLRQMHEGVTWGAGSIVFILGAMFVALIPRMRS